jgi:hypothetical protein
MQFKARSLTQGDVRSLQNTSILTQHETLKTGAEKRAEKITQREARIRFWATQERKRNRYALLIEFVCGVYFNNDI